MLSVMKLFASIAFATMISLPAIASADETAVTVTTLKPITIVGRPNRPNVTIELTRPTAAHEAGAAHAAMRASLVR